MKIISIDYFSSDAPKLFSDSLKNTGFAVFTDHPINWNLINDVYTEWKHFLTSNNASKYLFNKEKQDGYFPLNISETAKGNNKKDLKHFYHIYKKGRYPYEVSNKAKKLFNEFYDFGRILIKWIDQYSNRELSEKNHCSLVDILSLDKTLLRILHYPITKKNNAGAVRAAAHEDIDLLTLLPAASTPGLEIYSPEEEEWLPVDYEKQSIIVNIGDMLQEITNFEYISTKHRVTNPKKNYELTDRVSTPFFLHAKDNTFLSERYPTAKIFLEERLKEIGIK